MCIRDRPGARWQTVWAGLAERTPNEAVDQTVVRQGLPARTQGKVADHTGGAG